jgi:hypothetical protein
VTLLQVVQTIPLQLAQAVDPVSTDVRVMFWLQILTIFSLIINKAYEIYSKRQDRLFFELKEKLRMEEEDKKRVWIVEDQNRQLQKIEHKVDQNTQVTERTLEAADNVQKLKEMLVLAGLLRKDDVQKVASPQSEEKTRRASDGDSGEIS